MNRSYRCKGLLHLLLIIASVVGASDRVFADPSVNLAVVDASGSGDLSALVVTELSTNPGLHLLERDDLAKVGDEAKVQQLAGSDAVALGKLVGADGLIFISKRDSGMEIRLTSVGLGYALFDDLLPASADLPTEAKSIAHLASGYSAQLKLSPSQVIPISVLNLRADLPTPQATELERKLTLLLESRLASEPHYVVLERRHAWSLGFERSINSAAAALIPGSYIVDGTFDLTNPGPSNVTLHLRLRSSGGKEVQSMVTGSSRDLAALAGQLVAEIGKATGTNSGTAWQSQNEAREYLLEGFWGWQHKAYDEAMEALDSAELLGEKAPQLYTLRSVILCEEAGEGLAIDSNSIRLPDQPDPKAHERAVMLLRAYDNVTQWRNAVSSPAVPPPAPLPDAMHVVTQDDNMMATLTTMLLVLLDRDSPADAGPVRDALRTITKYDPLHGSTGGGLYANGYIGLRDLRANEWPKTLEEQLAFYRIICSSPDQYIPSAFFRGGGDFCHRFLTTPEQQAAGFKAFVETLATVPDAHQTYLLIVASSDDPVKADAAYKEWINWLWQNREAFATENLDPRWASPRELPHGVMARNAAAGLPLLHYTLQHQNKFIGSYEPFLAILWYPEAWSESDAAQVWKDFQDFKGRLVAEAKAKDRNVDFIERELAAPEAKVLARFPNLAVTQTPVLNADALVTNHFWYPWRAGQWPNADWFHYSIQDEDATGVWMTGFNRLEECKLLHVALPDLTTQIIDMPGARVYPREVKATPGAVFMVEEGIDGPGNSRRHQIARYDLASAQWALHDLPACAECKLYPVGHSLYFFMRVVTTFPHSESSIVRYDWDSDQMTVLSSTRRHPGQNQFDDRDTLNQVQIFAGPGGKPCAATDDGVVWVQDTPGTWPLLYDCAFWDHAIISNGLTLVQNQHGEATLVDPNAKEVEHVMAASKPFVRNRPAPGQQPQKVMTPWAAQTIWDGPDGDFFYNKVAFTSDRLFILNAPAVKGGDYDLMVYQKGQGRTARHIPLEFHLTDSDRAQLATVPAHAPANWQENWIEHPDLNTFIHDVQVSGAPQGLIIEQMESVGFWFVPYTEIDGWLKAHPEHASK